jgi:hypothetical protein
MILRPWHDLVTFPADHHSVTQGPEGIREIDDAEIIDLPDARPATFPQAVVGPKNGGSASQGALRWQQ